MASARGLIAGTRILLLTSDRECGIIKDHSMTTWAVVKLSVDQPNRPDQPTSPPRCLNKRIQRGNKTGTEKL